MKKLVAALAALCALTWASAASAQGWFAVVPHPNVVASLPTTGGGYPVPPGATAPVPGTCRAGLYNSNRSESWVAVKPGTEDLVGVSKFFFENFSTFYDFHLGSYTMPGGVAPGPNTQIPGYDCISTGTQAMPPSWTNNTDPNVDFDSQGRAYQITLPFNAYWVNLHPNGAIGAVYSDDLGLHWTVGNGGKYLDMLPNSSSLAFGDVVDKQWVAVNHFPTTQYQDHVYAMWSVFNGYATKIRFAKSVDRGQTFTPAKTITPPSVVGPSTTYIYPSVGSDGTLYAAVAGFHGAAVQSSAELYVARSTDDGQTFTWFDTGQRAHSVSGCCLPNTTFRDGILENFTASPDYPGHLYLTYEDWDGTQFDVKFTQSTDGGMTWSAPIVVNDNTNEPTDQFQPSVAAGPGGAVAVAFYDRREACPANSSVRPQDVGRTNFCIDVSLQAYKDDGSGAVPVPPVGSTVPANVRMTESTWDPMQPDQHVDGIGQMACAAHQDPCKSRAFIGDYFGLAISGGNIYGLFVSTHYPSSVPADEGGPVYYQQQVLGTVPRLAFGAGY